MSITDSSGDQCPRKFYTLFPRRYCWQHTPKAGFILTTLIGAVVGAVISLGITESYRSLIPSLESRQIVETGNQIGKHVDAIAVLSADIENLHVIIAFENPMAVDLAPRSELLLRLSKQSGSTYRHLEVLGQTMEVHNDKKERVWGFRFETLVMIADDTTNKERSAME